METYQKQLAKVKTNTDAWAALVKGDPQLETVARNLADYLRSYEEAGQQYHAGMLAEQSANTEMANAAKLIIDTVSRLQSSLNSKMQTTTARTNTIMLTMAVSGIVVTRWAAGRAHRIDHDKMRTVLLIVLVIAAFIMVVK